MSKIMFVAPTEKVENTTDPASDITADVAVTKSVEYEPKSALAMGVPTAWSIEPPAIVVRRKVRTI